MLNRVVLSRKLSVKLDIPIILRRLLKSDDLVHLFAIERIFISDLCLFHVML